MKIIPFAFLLSPTFLFCQSKNHTIETQQKTIDSLEMVISNLQNNNRINNNRVDSLEMLTLYLRNDRDSLFTYIENLEQNNSSSQLKHNCQEAFGNSASNYPIRTDGYPNGCIGENCRSIPTDSDLHKAILSIKKDYNSDTIIDIMDLASAIAETGDINADGKSDIYDLVYPEKIRSIASFSNPRVVNENKSVELIGKLEQANSTFKLSLSSSLSLKGADGNVHSVNEIEIALAESVLYVNKTIVVKGVFITGITKVYGNNGWVLSSQEILGYIE